jgi:phenylacetate-CoA ligase
VGGERLGRRDLARRLAQRLYLALSEPGQTAAVNLFGIRNRLRMSAWTRYLSEIEYTETLPREGQVELVAGLLREMLGHVVRTVPRYESMRRLLPDLESGSADVFSLLGEFPVVERAEIAADRRSFTSREPGTRDVVETRTSGTTGTPFTTPMEAATFTRTDALWWRRNVWSGYRRGQWIARLVGDPAVPVESPPTRRPWRVSWIDRRLYLSTFHLSRQTAPSYLDVLERRKPEYIMGYPSSLEILASFCVEAGRRLEWSPLAVWFSSEPMLGHQRSLIEKVLRAPIRGLYGSAERIISAAECPVGSYHLSLVDGYVEGQFGRVPAAGSALVTSLMNRVMPFVRYKLGDVVTPRPDALCPCGRTLPVIEPVITKMEDWLETPSGRRISPSAITWSFKDLAGVRRSQVVQVDDGTIVVRVDADESAMGPVREALLDRLGKLFFGEMDIQVVRDENLKMLESGKTKFVVRERH